MASTLEIVLGLVLLGAGGELLVRGASRLALYFSISPLVIGLTVVAFGTSAPELAVSIQSIRVGTAGLAVGNVVGSNIFNILVIAGVSALILPLAVSRRVVRVEVPIMVGVSCLAVILALDGVVGVGDGLVLLGLVFAYMGWLARAGSGEAATDGTRRGTQRAAIRAALVASGGVAVLVIGARVLVNGAVAIATALGVSDVVIGLTIVAAGTSLPEAAASVVAALRGEGDIAVGNVVGSNILNLTLILGSTAVMSGGLGVPPGLVSFDLVVMLAVAVACLPIFFTGHRIARWEGGLFVAYYVAYALYLVLDATDHALLPHLQDALLFFALPLTGITLGVMVTRAVSRNGAEPQRPPA
jgi:cation:H+ antiporter